MVSSVVAGKIAERDKLDYLSQISESLLTDSKTKWLETYSVVDGLL